MSYSTHRRALQVFVGVTALFPLWLGFSGMLNGAPQAEVSDAYWAILDSNIRFRSALLFSIGAMFFWVIPRIETQTAWFRGLLASLFLGGLARLWGFLETGVPSTMLLILLVLELSLPLVCVPWQGKVARLATASA